RRPRSCGIDCRIRETSRAGSQRPNRSDAMRSNRSSRLKLDICIQTSCFARIGRAVSQNRARWTGIRCTLAGFSILAIAISGCGAAGGIGEGSAGSITTVAGLPEEANRLIRERTLSPDDVTAALATYMPTGKLDEYVMFASGGHGGQVLA